MTPQNKLVFAQDHEHRKVTVSPHQNAIVKDVRLVYYAPGIHMPRHTHGTGQFSTLLLGHAMQDCNSEHLDNQQGLAEFKPIGFSHSNKIGPAGVVFLSSNIDTDHPAFQAEFGHIRWHLTELKHAGENWQRLCSLLFNPANSLNVDIEELLLGSLSASVPYRGKIKQAPVWLKLAQQALHDHVTSIEQIAQCVGVHRVHLCRVFQAHFGLSVSSYKQRLAIQKSLKALLDGKRDIVMASCEAGFADQSHFTRVLKKHFGITPSQLRQLFNP